MTRGLILRTTLPLLAGLLLALGSCATSKSSKFYTLEPISSVVKGTSDTSVRRLSIAVGPIQLPGYLDRPQIMTRVDDTNELHLAEYNRWAGPLEDDFSSVLADNLSILLRTDQVASFPARVSLKFDYRVMMEVSQFDGSLGGEARLIARWTIYGQDGKQVLVMNKSSLSAPVKGSEYQDLVRAQNETLNELSRQIAAAIQSLSKSKPST